MLHIATSRHPSLTGKHSKSTKPSPMMLLLALLLTLLPLAVASTASASERLYVVGTLQGPLRAGLESSAHIRSFEEAASAEAGESTDSNSLGMVVMTGEAAATLGPETSRRLATAYRAGWPLALVAADAQQINDLHRAARTGQVFKLPHGGKPPEAFALVQRANGGYAQMRVYAGGDQTAAPAHRQRRAASLLAWLAEARRQRLQADAESRHSRSSQAQSAADDSEPDDLTQIVSAWVDSPYFYYSDSVTGGQSLFQCTAEVWQAYQVSTENDYYYVEQNCNFSPQNTYAIRGKTLDVGWPLSIVGADDDWDQVSWSTTTNGSAECPNSGDGNAYTACDYYNYATGYNVNLQPYSPTGSAVTDVSMVVLTQENPPTTESDTTVTEGVSYTISGQVVAGTTNSNVSASAGVTISTTTSTTIPDVIIHNDSVSNSTNAQWKYEMQPVAYIDDSCTNSMNAPATVQTSTFNPRQDMLWSVDSSYRSLSGFGGTFDVALEFTFTGLESAMYVDESGTRNVSNKSDCNTFACSCGIVTSGPWTRSSGVQILSIPVPSTDYQG